MLSCCSYCTTALLCVNGLGIKKARINSDLVGMVRFELTISKLRASCIAIMLHTHSILRCGTRTHARTTWLNRIRCQLLITSNLKTLPWGRSSSCRSRTDYLPLKRRLQYQSCSRAIVADLPGWLCGTLIHPTIWQVGLVLFLSFCDSLNTEYRTF